MLRSGKLWRRIALACLLAASPPPILSLWMSLLGPGAAMNDALMYAGLAIALAGGVAGVLIFPIPAQGRGVAAILYAPTMLGILFLWGITYGCAAFGLCP